NHFLIQTACLPVKSVKKGKSSMKKTTNDWLISAENDIQLNSNILHIEQLTHLIAFHTQQAIENTLPTL
ncbi:MAG: hypothetical protein PWR04_1574, partial [Anaerophaga sp.]|nr:hypothetical protein [Anaerophaga sp.]